MSFKQLASQDYERALHKAAWRKILTRLKGESNELLPYDEVRGRAAVPWTAIYRVA